MSENRFFSFFSQNAKFFCTIQNIRGRISPDALTLRRNGGIIKTDWKEAGIEMNILYLHTHDSGRYLSPYGWPAPTRNLQKLAEEGTVFRNACCAAPTCSPSRAAMLSGMAPHCAGMLGLAHRGFQMQDYSRHLAHYLGQNGFATALCGVQHEAPDAAMIGYRRILDREAPGTPANHEEGDLRNAQLAAQYIREAPEGQPFFLSFGMFQTHRPYPHHEGHINPNYLCMPFPIADTPENRADMADYLRSAQIADDCAGVVLRALRESGRERDTVVLFTTDHGIAMPGMKCSLYDAGIGVALMLRYPGNPAAGRAIDSLVSHLDIFPTLCDLAGVPKPGWLQGRSLLPLLRGSKAEIRDELFAEVTYHAAYEPMRCIRTRRYKLIRRFDFHCGPVPANTDASAPKDFWMQNGWLSRPVAREMLFDLALDPAERVNLVGDAACFAVYNDLSARLNRWMEETDDPLLRCGCRVPAPSGAKVNRLRSLQPGDMDWE